MNILGVSYHRKNWKRAMADETIFCVENKTHLQ